MKFHRKHHQNTTMCRGRLTNINAAQSVILKTLSYTCIQFSLWDWVELDTWSFRGPA